MLLAHHRPARFTPFTINVVTSLSTKEKTLKKIVFALLLLLAIPIIAQQPAEPTVTELKAQIAQYKLQILQLQSALLQCQAPQVQQEVQSTQSALREEQEKKKPVEKKPESKEVKPTGIK